MIELQFAHEPVLLEESLEALKLKPKGVYVDCTLGGAGHSLAMLATEPSIRLIGIDQDPQAIARAKYRLVNYTGQVSLVHDNFRNLKAILTALGIEKVHGILMDIGVSSPQLGEGARGFSYQKEGRLDMRMDPNNPVDAWALVNTYSEKELTKIISDYGEERWAARISEFIVKRRQREPIDTTFDLVEVIKNAIPAGARGGEGHPARRTFQALRIAVNDELGALKEALEQAVEVLYPAGRLAVISFHSLEDRLVKNHFQNLLGRCTCPPGLPVCACDQTPVLRLVTRRPIEASPSEVSVNPRARSAKLRVAEKI